MKALRTLLFAALIFVSSTSFAQKTTIWLVRHAEKATDQGDDPGLSEEGKVRAMDLAKLLKNQKIAAVFTTPYKRTSQTGEPVLKLFGLATLQNYQVLDLTGLAKQILTEYPGREVLVIGHSNTIIPTLKAFGAKSPTDLLDDDDYDLIFKLTVDMGKTTGLEIKHYGTSHHSNKPVPVKTMVLSN